MLSRNQHEQKGIILPTQWQSDTQALLESVYKEKLGEKTFFVFGQTFPNELFIGISLISRVNHASLPVSYCLSAEIDTKTDHTKLLENMIDFVGIFFDTYFSTPNWDDYSAIWTEHRFKSTNFFYKITRENIDLTLKANQLLGD